MNNLFSYSHHDDNDEYEGCNRCYQQQCTCCDNCFRDFDECICCRVCGNAPENAPHDTDLTCDCCEICMKKKCACTTIKSDEQPKSDNQPKKDGQPQKN